MTSPTLTATGDWTAAGALPTAAVWSGQHDGAAPLDDGALLVAGGADATGASVNRAAVYDPGANTWRPTDGLRTPRRLHSIIRLTDGTVLVAGGLGTAAAGGLASAEIYDPATGLWTPTRDMSIARWGHSAALLPDGTVLVAGGTTNRSGSTNRALVTTERYDPATGRWSPAGSMLDARTGHVAVVLAGGAVLACGGSAPVGTADDPALAFCELYNPTTDRWSPTGSLRHARRRHQATRLSDRGVLITGGSAPGAPGGGRFDPFSQRTAERFNLDTGVWAAVEDMPAGRALHRAVPLGPGRVLVVGGAATARDEAGFRSAIIYDDAAEHLWSPAAGLDGGRWSFAVAALPAGRVLVAGGVVRSGLAAADPASPELTASAERFRAGEDQ